MGSLHNCKYTNVSTSSFIHLFMPHIVVFHSLLCVYHGACNVLTPGPIFLALVVTFHPSFLVGFCRRASGWPHAFSGSWTLRMTISDRSATLSREPVLLNARLGSALKYPTGLGVPQRQCRIEVTYVSSSTSQLGFKFHSVPSCVILDLTFNFSESQNSHIKKRKEHLVEFLKGLHEIMPINSPPWYLVHVICARKRVVFFFSSLFFFVVTMNMLRLKFWI